MRILIADDLPLQVRELSDGIRSVWPDWEILTADNGQSVVEAVSTTSVDLVLSDIRMPRMDGLEMLSVVREISPKTKIVFITAYPLFEYAQQALKLGASDFLLKPVDMLALYDTLSRLTSEGEEPALGEELKICLTEDFRRLSAPMQKRIRGCLTEGCVCALSFPTSRKLPQPRYLAAEIGSRAGCSVVAAEMHAGAETRRYALVCSAGEWDSGSPAAMRRTRRRRRSWGTRCATCCSSVNTAPVWSGG